MKSITIGRVGCDILIPENCISRKHAIISLINGQYVFQDTSKNGSFINGIKCSNQRVVISPGTPVFLANKIPLPWAQVLMLLPKEPYQIQKHSPQVEKETVVDPQAYVYKEDSINPIWGIVSFLFPILGFILYLVWRDSSPKKAEQAAKFALINLGLSFLLSFLYFLFLYILLI